MCRTLIGNKRYINLIPAINFSFVLQISCEAAAVTFQFALSNGGPASIVYGSIFSGIGTTLVALSLAEMASMYVSSVRKKIVRLIKLRDPTVGAQYRWSATFAPKWNKFFGLMQGQSRAHGIFEDSELIKLRLDYCVCLDLLMHFESCVDIKCGRRHCNFQQSILCSREVARYTLDVGCNNPTLCGKHLVQKAPQSHSRYRCYLPHPVLYCQHHHPPCNGRTQHGSICLRYSDSRQERMDQSCSSMGYWDTDTYLSLDRYVCSLDSDVLRGSSWTNATVRF